MGMAKQNSAPCWSVASQNSTKAVAVVCQRRGVVQKCPRRGTSSKRDKLRFNVRPLPAPAKCQGCSWEERAHPVSIPVLLFLSKKAGIFKGVVEVRDGNLVQGCWQQGACFAPGSACLADSHSRRLSLRRAAHPLMVRGRAAACGLKRRG